MTGYPADGISILEWISYRWISLRSSTEASEKNELRSQINSTIESCTKLQLDMNRQAYFKEAELLRLRDLEPEPSSGTGGPGNTAPLASLLKRPEPLDEGEVEKVDSSISER